MYLKAGVCYAQKVERNLSECILVGWKTSNPNFQYSPYRDNYLKWYAAIKISITNKGE